MLTDFFWYPDLQYKDCHVHVGFHLNHIHFFLPIVYMWWAQVQSCLLPFPKDHQPLTCCLQYIIISTCFINNLKTLPLLRPTAALVSYLIFTYNNVLYVILTNHTTIFTKTFFEASHYNQLALIIKPLPPWPHTLKLYKPHSLH